MFEFLLYIHMAILLVGVIFHKIYTSQDPEIFNTAALYKHETWIVAIITFTLGYYLHQCATCII